MNEKVYMHAINSKDYNFFNSQAEINNLQHILQDGALKSLRLQGYDESHEYGYNGLDYISLCDYEKRDLHPDYLPRYNSYHSYVQYGISLAFDKQKIEVIEPTILEPFRDYIIVRKRISNLGLGKDRYTDLPDEVQVKDKISLEHLLYITYPVSKFFEFSLYLSRKARIKALKNEIEHIIRLLSDYNYNGIEIYDIDTETLLDSEGIERLLCK